MGRAWFLEKPENVRFSNKLPLTLSECSTQTGSLSMPLKELPFSSSIKKGSELKITVAKFTSSLSWLSSVLRGGLSTIRLN